MTEQRLAVVRTVGSSKLGHGHLHRCLALADTLIAGGMEVGFAINDAALAPAKRLWQDRFKTVCVETGDGSTPQSYQNLEEEIVHLRTAFGERIAWLIVDHYQRDAVFETMARGWAVQILAVDDLRRRHAVDILVDAAPGRSPDDYANLAPAALRLCGPTYAFLKSGFASLRRAAAHKPTTISDRPSLLISLGGTDPQDILPQLLRMLTPLREAIRISVAVSSAAANLNTVQQAAEDIGAALLVDHNDMPRLLATTDVAIGAGGVSALERCCLGIPSLLLEVAPNQADTIHGLVGAGAAERLNWPTTETALVSAVRQLIWDEERREAMAALGRQLCDGGGSMRVATCIIHPQVDSAGRRIHLRPVTAADSEVIFGWQCQPGARRFSRTPEPPAWVDHQRWSKRMIERADAHYDIILCGNEPAGVLRLEPKDGGYEVSILVSSEYGRSGVASSALHLARRLQPDSPLFAFIHPENTASRTAFAKAGFAPDVAENWYIAPPQTNQSPQSAKER